MSQEFFPARPDSNPTIYAYEDRDIPGLAEALAPIFAHREPHLQYSRVFDFAHLLKAAGKASLFEEGLIAQAFEDRYKEKLSFLEEMKRKEAEHSDRSRASSAWEEKNSHASDFYNLYDHIATLAHFLPVMDYFLI